MADDESGTEAAGDIPESAVDDAPTIPKARFDEVLASNRDLKRRLETLEAEAQAKADAEAEEQGKWRELAEKTRDQLKALAPKAEAYDAYFSQRKAALIEQIPEDLRDLVPQMATDHETVSWIETARSKGLLSATDDASDASPTVAPKLAPAAGDKRTRHTRERVAQALSGASSARELLAVWDAIPESERGDL